MDDDTAAQFYGTPFAGARRNLQRGDSVNNANLAILKRYKLSERITIEARGNGL